MALWSHARPVYFSGWAVVARPAQYLADCGWRGIGDGVLVKFDEGTELNKGTITDTILVPKPRLDIEM